MSDSLNKKCVLCWTIFFHVIDGYFTFVFEPAHESVKVEDDADRWVSMSHSHNNKRVLSGVILFHVIAGYLAFIFEPFTKILTW
jgi:hypothetical protein